MPDAAPGLANVAKAYGQGSVCVQVLKGPGAQVGSGERIALSGNSGQENRRCLIFSADLSERLRPVFPHWVFRLTTANVVICRRADQSAETATVRSLSGCTGRLLPSMIARNVLICSVESSTGDLRTIQRTSSVQGGVVNDPV